MKWVPVSQNKWAIVDDEDYERVAARRWQLRRGSCRVLYATTQLSKKKYIAMHQFLLPAPRGFEVDHINGNGLDNRRCNIRVVTRQQNAMNKGPNKNNRTGYKGVCFDKSRGLYLAGVKVNYRRVNLGRYRTAEEAARVYDKAARHYHGEYARLNFAEAS